MNGELSIQVVLLLAGVFTALTGALGAIVAALCWFLKRLVDKVLPDIVQQFHQDLAAEREVCQRGHERIMQRIDERHAELMAELRR